MDREPPRTTEREKHWRDRHARLAIAMAIARHMGTHPEKVPGALITELQALAAPQPAASSDFCDGHCTWLDHHPACERADPAAAPRASQ